jgi:hypothetical protein
LQNDNFLLLYTSHHNHLDCIDLTKGAHSLCLESIRCPNFLFGKKDFKPLFPSIILTMLKKIWSTMSHYLTIPPPPQFDLPCLLLDRNTPNYCIKFDIMSITLHSSHSKNFANFYSSMYYRELCSSINIFDSMTCLYLFWLNVCLFIKGKVHHYLFFEKVQNNFLKLLHGNSFNVFYCKPLSLLKMG